MKISLPLSRETAKEKKGFIIDNKMDDFVAMIISKIKELLSFIIMQQTPGFNIININSSLCIEVISTNVTAINVNVIFNNR